MEGSDKVEGGIPLEAESKELILSKKNNVPAPLSMDSEEENRTNVSARGKGKVEVANNWTMLEMGLYEKGLQIFGKNRYRNWNILICQIQLFHLQILTRDGFGLHIGVKTRSFLSMGNTVV
jgi:hypothetical protein